MKLQVPYILNQSLSLMDRIGGSMFCENCNNLLEDCECEKDIDEELERDIWNDDWIHDTDMGDRS